MARLKVMDKGAVTALAQRHIQDWWTNYKAVDKIDRWYRNDLYDTDKPALPADVDREYLTLRERAMTPWLRFVVRSLAQGLYVEGYRRSDRPGDLAPWAMWQRNGMDARQLPLHRNAFAHGLSYQTILPGNPVPVMRGVSARKMVAFYADSSEDEWPMFAIRGDKARDRDGREFWRFRLYDEVAVYTLDGQQGADNLTYISHEVHNVGVCPVVRYVNEMDLDGNIDGEVAPNISLAARIHQDDFDRLIVQRFGAWLVRYIAGLKEPPTDPEKKAQKRQLRVEDFLVAADPNTKFGALPATPLDGYIKAHEADVRDLAVMTQTPPADLLGHMINMSAEALAAAEASRTRKWQERKHTWGESHEQSLRLGAHIMGDEEAAADFSAQVVWRDVESRSLAQVADAFGKLATMLNFPAEILWEKIPGMSQQDVERAKEIIASNGGIEGLLRELTQSQDPPAA